ncbi:type III secretion system chaperone [Hahella sp. HN01]|uniref:type III secretion system chaperone n=1 Tax=Hahella sp. HN01 TaxID=2847262 RepID=UPI001C1E9660|nr:type III secretion system chaperone [Hahella sp. HN01]MBU6956056.1 type III secretion system chaperone [Hahella sp. HN01]
MNGEHVESLIKEIGRRMKISLPLESGSAAFEDKEGDLWLIEVSPAEDSLLIHCTIIQGVSLSPEHYRTALALNFRCDLLRCCYFSLNELNGSLRLCLQVETEHLSADILENKIVNMMEVKEQVISHLLKNGEQSMKPQSQFNALMKV